MARKSPVTIKTIAEELNISFSTVSKALNNDPLIKLDTRKAVWEKAKEMGYSPNMNARSLRSKKSHTIGIILNDIENPTFAHILSAITNEMANFNYTTLVCDSKYNVEMERRNILSLISRNTDSIIISPVTMDADRLDLLNPMMEKVIVLSEQIKGFNANYVHVDYKTGGYLAAKKMLQSGHIVNLIISEKETTTVNRQYIAGIKHAYEEHNVDFNESLLFHCIPSLSNGYKTIMDLYNKYKANNERLPFTGVMCICDSLAFGVYQAVANIGLNIPNDISVIGFDDYYPSEIVQPPLSTVYLPKERVALYCIDLLRIILLEKETDIRTVIFEPYLVIRNSIKNL